MIPDCIQVKSRLRKKIEEALVSYQKTGKYTDADGKTWTDSLGIVKMWEEYENEG